MLKAANTSSPLPNRLPQPAQNRALPVGGVFPDCWDTVGIFGFERIRVLSVEVDPGWFEPREPLIQRDCIEGELTETETDTGGSEAEGPAFFCGTRFSLRWDTIPLSTCGLLEGPPVDLRLGVLPVLGSGAGEGEGGATAFIPEGALVVLPLTKLSGGI